MMKEGVDNRKGHKVSFTLKVWNLNIDLLNVSTDLKATMFIFKGATPKTIFKIYFVE